MNKQATREAERGSRQERSGRGTGSTGPRNQQIKDVMTPDPACLDASSSVMDAARLMRDNDIGDVIVLENERLCGIVTDRDIVVRVLSESSDPMDVTVGDICSRELTTIIPTAPIEEAVRLIRQKAIRRLPVVDEDGDVVGIVTIGDLAVSRDPRSALADVSSAPANT